VDRERLLEGNWNIRESAGMFFKEEWFEVIGAAPAGLELVRYWDMAATAENEAQGGTAYSAGVLMGKDANGFIYVLDVKRLRGSPGQVLQTIKNVASQDGTGVTIGLEQDPGQAGKAQVQLYARELGGYRVKAPPARESKGARAKPYAAQVEQGNVKVVRGHWTKTYLRECENFDGVNGIMDQVDASSGAFMLLARRSRAGAW
jgi:predicted phage terminase large subunit-like protein